MRRLVAILGLLFGKREHRMRSNRPMNNPLARLGFAAASSRAASVSSSAARWPSDIFEVSINGALSRVFGSSGMAGVVLILIFLSGIKLLL